MGDHKSCGCDMRGMLSFFILWLLDKRAMHGEELAKEIGSRKGHTPKPGTIYPALKHLKEEGLIEGKKEDGKTIRYHLTEEGHEVLDEALVQFYNSFSEVLKDAEWIIKGHPKDI